MLKGQNKKIDKINIIYIIFISFPESRDDRSLKLKKNVYIECLLTFTLLGKTNRSSKYDN